MITNKRDILLVEDSPSDAELAIIALHQGKIQGNIVHVEDGAEALHYIFATGEYAHRNAESVPGIIFLDLKMPKVTGIEVLRRIKADERTKQIPVVVFTSSQELLDVKEGYRLGANSYVVKPVEFAEFSEIVIKTGVYWLSVNHVPV